MRTLVVVLGWALIIGGGLGALWLTVLNVRHRRPDWTVLQSITLPDHWVGSYGDRYGACAVALAVGMILVFGNIG